MTFEKQFEYDERQVRLMNSYRVMDEFDTREKHEMELNAAEKTKPDGAIQPDPTLQKGNQ